VVVFSQFVVAMWVCKLEAVTCDYIKALEGNIISKLKGDFPFISWFQSRLEPGCLPGRWRSTLRDKIKKSLVGLTDFGLLGV